MQELACIVLCAGQGTRMKSMRSKMLHEIAGKPLCLWSLDLANDLGARPVIPVLGYQKESVAAVLNMPHVIQEQQLGTGHAVQVAFQTIHNFKGRVLVLYGDTPLLKHETLQKLIDLQKQTHAQIAMLTSHVKLPHGYGRIVRQGSAIKQIVEERDATPDEQKITEINPGIYVFDAEFLRKHLSDLNANNQKHEYYLTDLIALSEKPIASIEVAEEEILGVNDLVQLAKAERILRRRINEHWMRQGVQMLDYKTTYIDIQTKLSADVILEEGVVLRGACEIASGVRIGAYSVLQDAIVGSGCQVGPFARLRPQTVLGENCKIGNFVEVKKSTFGKGSKANHLAYIGDAEIGERCNVGAGTITCNYDGVKKHQTKMDDGVFVGSNSTLIAPLHLHEGAYIGAGSVINQDVPAGSLGLGRSRQENKANWKSKK
ncbi:MAG: bifunctional UDP-N-acetylglucosamine diphosphorylase/glucosamine-1-phosphate N-acetyltransferase GlmU [Myxococcota bacterium]